MKVSDNSDPSISICIATCKRADLLNALLGDIIAQTCDFDELVIVDNDIGASAREVVASFEKELAVRRPLIKVRYDIQPIKNISITRNRTVELATSEWLAFLDDDERISREWLGLIVEAGMRYQADGVLGPFLPAVPESASNWIKRGHFYDWYRMTSGTQVPVTALRFGNVLLRSSALGKVSGPFDPVYGITGGEDGDLLCRLMLQGAKLVWCDEAVVIEPIEEKRLNAKWLWMRALRGGQDFATHTIKGRYGKLGIVGKLVFVSRAFVQMIAAAFLALIALPFGLHRTMYWVFKIAANLGKLSKFWGWHYQEYA